MTVWQSCKYTTASWSRSDHESEEENKMPVCLFSFIFYPPSVHHWVSICSQIGISPSCWLCRHVSLIPLWCSIVPHWCERKSLLYLLQAPTRASLWVSQLWCYQLWKFQTWSSHVVGETVATGDARVSITSLTATPSGRLAVDLRHASCLVLTAHTFSLIQSKPVHYIHHSLNLVL